MEIDIHEKPPVRITTVGRGQEFLVLDFKDPGKSGVFEVVALIPAVTLVDRERGNFVRVGLESLIRYGGSPKRRFVPFSRESATHILFVEGDTDTEI